MKEQLKKADLFGLVLVASALIAYFIRGDWTILQTIVVSVGAALIVVSLALKSGEIRTGMGRRSTKFGINSGVITLLFIGVLVLVNYLADRHQRRFDMTSEHLHSLGDESVKAVAALQKDIRIKAFYPGGDEPDVRDLLELYAHQSNRISLDFVDPDKNPKAAEQYQVTMYDQVTNPLTGRQQKFGTVVLDAGDNKIERIEKRSAPTEEDVTNALLKVTRSEQKTVYFVEGHGEKAIDGGDRTGYEVASNALTKDGYKVSKLNLVREEKIPADASVVVIAGPLTEPFPEELNKVDAYLNAGGSVLLMVDPPPAATLKDFTEKWAVSVGNNRVIDATGMGQLLGKGPDTPLVTSYGAHPILDRFNLMTFFPLTRSVTPTKTPPAGVTAEPLLETNSKSWGESDLKSNEVEFNEKTDLKGPVPIAVAVTKDVGTKDAAAKDAAGKDAAAKDTGADKKARLIVFGDSDFAINANFSNQGNGNLFINTVKWLARDEKLISIKTKDPTDRAITMTQSGGRTVGFITVLLLPASALIAGVLVWVKRRK